MNLNSMFASGGFFLAALVCCGEAEEKEMSLAFQRHALTCTRPGLEAKLEALGVADCPLSFTAENTVEGICEGFEPGTVYPLRLVYYTQLPAPADPSQLDLATAIEVIDLTGVTDSEIVVSFSEISTYPDDDGDSKSNLVEWCGGTDPRGP